MCQHISHEEYIIDTFELCIECIKDFMDAPIAELTLDQIHKDFGSPTSPISDEQARKILEYYNGRLKIYQQIKSELTSIHKHNSMYDNIVVRRYNIPHEYNEFVVDENEALYDQNEAYIEVIIEKNVK